MPVKTSKAATRNKVVAKSVKSASAKKTPVKAAVAAKVRIQPKVAKPAARPAVKLAKVEAKPVKVEARLKVVAKVKPKAVPKVEPAVVPKVVAAPAVELKVKMPDFTFEKGDFVVYPTHGVGRVVDIEAKQIAGITLDLFVISFEQERMTLRVPVAKARTSGLRKLSSRKIMDSALVTLKGRSRISRAMWNRRAQEYEAKINSGDPVSIAEVVRDLHRNAGQPDQSYSERQIYEAALDRLARELAAVERIDNAAATVKLQGVLKQVA